MNEIKKSSVINIAVLKGFFKWKKGEKSRKIHAGERLQIRISNFLAKSFLA